MSATDPRHIIDQSKMTAAQIAVVVITVFLNAMDGFDVLSIAFASPLVAKEWNISPLELGNLLGMELYGMAIGSIVLGGVADKIGRRPTLLGCLLVMTLGMLGATTATGALQLSIWRVLTGLGIGGVLSATNATVAEFSNAKHRAICIAIMVIGYPLGGGFGGLFASSLIATNGWHAVFYLGAAATGILIPTVYFLVPESVHWMTRQRPANALERINHSLRKLGHPTVFAMPPADTQPRKASLAEIFSPGLIGTTLLVAGAYFLHILTFYFLLKWTPKLVTDLGFAPSQGGWVLTMANFGGAAGGAIFGILTARIGLKPLTIGILLFNTISVAVFGHFATDFNLLTTASIVVGFFGNAAISGLYSIAAYAFPTHVRATGTGFVIGFGRFGSIASPAMVGYLFQNNTSLSTVCVLMCIGSLLAALVLMFLQLNTNAERPVPAGH